MRARRLLLSGVVTLLLLAGVALLAQPLLGAAGRFLVRDDAPPRADAAVVLATGLEYYDRLIEAAALYREGRVGR
ncbi:MAG TPA: YdcF family protein, partial [Gammaproteobacteria bacterium]